MHLLSKRGQLTIFVIVALLIVAAVALVLYVLNQGRIEITPAEYKNPLQYMETCTTEATQEAINILLTQGDKINPVLYQLYNGSKIAFICYTPKDGVNEKCKNQNPLLLENSEKQIADYISPIIDNCFSKLKEEYEKRNYATQMSSYQNVEVSIMEKQVSVETSRDFSFDINGEFKEYKTFKGKINSPIYKLLRTANEVANQESVNCDFDAVDYMHSNPSISIDKIDVNGEVSLYIIKDKATEKKLSIATRGCVNSLTA